MIQTESTEHNQEYKPRVLLIDDNPQFLVGIGIPLDVNNFDIVTAGNGKEALEILRKAHLQGQREGSEISYLPDIIVSDVMMPEMDGYEFLEMARKIKPLQKVPVIFLTAKDNDEDIQKGMELGVDAHISKLKSADFIMATMRNVLKRSGYGPTEPPKPPKPPKLPKPPKPPTSDNDSDGDPPHLPPPISKDELFPRWLVITIAVIFVLAAIGLVVFLQ